MDYTNKVLEIISSELEPYVSQGGEPCIDGVLSSAIKINEFIQKVLNESKTTNTPPQTPPKSSITVNL